MDQLKISFISILLKVQNNILLLEKIIWRSKPSEINNIIIYKNGNIGDIITAYPTIRQIRLKYPNANILLLTSPGSKNLISSASILKSQDMVDEIVYYYDGKIFHLRDKIRKRNFDLCFIMSENRTTFFRELRNLLFFSTLNIISWFMSVNGFRLESTTNLDSSSSSASCFVNFLTLDLP